MFKNDSGQALTEYVLVLGVTTTAFVVLYELIFGIGDRGSVIGKVLEEWMSLISFVISMP